jgi:hypothetical protein
MSLRYNWMLYCIPHHHYHHWLDDIIKAEGWEDESTRRGTLSISEHCSTFNFYTACVITRITVVLPPSSHSYYVMGAGESRPGISHLTEQCNESFQVSGIPFLTLSYISPPIRFVIYWKDLWSNHEEKSEPSQSWQQLRALTTYGLYYVTSFL